MYSYDTVSEALNALRKRGFDHDFNINQEVIECKHLNIRLEPDAFEIVEHYRFEGETDPADESVVYAIQSTDASVKGTLVSAYGVYAETASETLIRKLTHK
ncbi:MAG: phosphoribosylpyrophosphate synthetase [Sphingobacteriia bacterium]|nr:phosphoribosylpyrophosphate synthetase [Sphingobacteriia bacterium]